MRALVHGHPARHIALAGVLAALAGLVAPGSSRGTEPASSAAGEEPRWWARDPGAATVPFPYVAEPVGSWVYGEVERQIVAGNLTGLHHHSRPFPRALLAARVAEALAAGRKSLGLERLARELAWETRMMGLLPRYRDTRPWITVGPVSSLVKFNGYVILGGEFEDHEKPVFGPASRIGFRGNYWHPSGFSLEGEYEVSEIENATRFGDPVVQGTDFQFTTPRFTAAWHGSFFETWGGRENARWGPGRRGGLMLGGGSETFTQWGYRVHLGTFLTASAIHAWLSPAEGRYAAFHRVEMDLGKGLRFGVGEGVRYDGTSPDPLYMINLVPYAAVERLATADGRPEASRDSLFRSNYVAAADLFWRPVPGWAAYGELMVDDVKTTESGVPTRLGYQMGALRVWEGRSRLTLQAEYTRIYNYTYSVYYGRDFFHREDPLGYPLGPDAQELNVWADLDFSRDASLLARFFLTRVGEGNDLRRGPWCDDPNDAESHFKVRCQNGSLTAGAPPGEEAVPSGRAFAGTVETRLGFEVGGTLAPRDNLRFEATVGLVQADNAGHEPGRDETRPRGRVQASWRW